MMTHTRAHLKHTCEQGKSDVLKMKSHGKESAKWWQRASFPPTDENHVSGASRAESWYGVMEQQC